MRRRLTSPRCHTAQPPSEAVPLNPSNLRSQISDLKSSDLKSSDLKSSDLRSLTLQAFDLPPAVLAHRPLCAKWAALLNSPQADTLKEQELLPDFLTDLFTTLFGYRRPADNPQRHTISREQHVEAFGKFADAVLGEFTPAARRFVVALEGKGPTDPLDRPFKNRSLSAVDQGYRYAINLPCDWIIVTSLRHTRLYCKGTDQNTYELFSIADLATNDHVFKKFVYLLAADRVVPPRGRCHFDLLRDASNKAGRELTKEFYQGYANMREDVYEQLCAHNSQLDRRAGTPGPSRGARHVRAAISRRIVRPVS